MRASEVSLVGIAGGSGSGKSTVSYALVDAEPEMFEVVNLDDYQKPPSAPDLPRLGTLVNWDHPDVIRWDDLLADLTALRAGKDVTLDVWAHRSNADYATTRRMIARTVHPRPVVLVEGYLALHDERLRATYSRSYYLDLEEETRARRRGKSGIVGVADYDTLVLQPMHRRYVEPTRAYADVVLDVSTLTVEDVVRRLRDEVIPREAADGR